MTQPSSSETTQRQKTMWTNTLYDDMATLFGPTMSVPELADVFKLKKEAVEQAVYAERFPVPTFKAGAKRLALTIEVAEYLAKARGIC